MHSMTAGKALNKVCQSNNYLIVEQDNKIYVKFSVTLE